MQTKITSDMHFSIIIIGLLTYVNTFDLKLHIIYVCRMWKF